MMRYYLLLCCAILIGLGAAGVSSAEEDHLPFLGLWKAVDGFDGSVQTLSITCASDDDCDVRLTDTAFTDACPNQTGYAHGKGTIEGNVLTVILSLTCNTPEGPSDPLTQLNHFVYHSDGGTLINLNDDPIETPNVFHKISKN